MNEKEHSAEFLMMKLLHVYAAKTFHQLSHVNLHPGQMPMLNLLYQQDGLSQKEICSKLCIKPSTVTVSLQRMEKSALVCRVADEKDKRIQRIYLTDYGRELHREVKRSKCSDGAGDDTGRGGSSERPDSPDAGKSGKNAWKYGNQRLF